MRQLRWALAALVAAAAALLGSPWRWPHAYYAAFADWGCVDAEGHVDGRYFRKDVCISPRQRSRAIARLVREMVELLESRDLDYWLDSGTLLGQFRRQAVIPWDNDADIGVTAEAFETLRSRRWTVPQGYKLQIQDSEFHDDGRRDVSIPARLVDRTFGFYVDVFVFSESRTAGGIEMIGPPISQAWKGCHKCPSVGLGPAKLFLIPKSYVFPLLPCEFEGFTALCPARRSLYLDHIYGPDFRVERMEG